MANKPGQTARQGWQMIPRAFLTTVLILSLHPGCANKQPPWADHPAMSVALQRLAEGTSDRPAGGSRVSTASNNVPVNPASAVSRAKEADPSELENLRRLHERAEQRYAEISDYICRFRRREFIHGKQEPEDLLEFRYRKQPESMYFKWIGGTLVGREMVYVKGKYDNRLQIRTGSGDPIAGFRISLEPHSARATANSRRTVDEAGVGNMVEQFGKLLEAHTMANGKGGCLRYLGLQERPESEVAMECVEQTIAPGEEKHLPRGGRRFWYFNQDSRMRENELPVLVVTLDETGREVEYYCFDRMNTNVGLSMDEFDPDYLWRRR